MLKLVFTGYAKSQYEAIRGKLKQQVDKALDRIIDNPECGKPLKGELKGIRSERVSRFRILYRIHNHELEILILVIGHRKNVYEA